MATRAEPIVISDDENDKITIDGGRRQHTIQTSEAGPSTRPRHELSASPSLYRDPKRQRLSTEQTADYDADIKAEFPKLRLNFETDEYGNSQLYPDFFEQAFVRHTTPDEEEVQLVLEIPREKEEEPPYFEDPKLQIRMYRGPGFEHFPIPFNTSHQEFCDRWDAKKRSRDDWRRSQQTRYNDFGSYIDPIVPVVDLDESAQASRNLSTGQTECLAKVLDVLPDVQREFVVEKIRSQQESYTFNDEEIEVLPDVDAMISDILEMENYPREVKVEKQVIPFEIETGNTIVWTKDHRQNRDYLKDAVIMLAGQFDYVPTHYIHKVIHEKETLWDSFVHIDEIDRNYFQRNGRPYARSKRPRISLEKKYQRSSPYRDPDYYSNVVTELQAAKQHRMREILQQEETQKKANAENENLERHKAEGLIVTCGCCFDDEIPLNRAVTCSAGMEEHSFCFSCIESLANSQIGMMRHEMQCMDGSGCQEKLDMDGVGRAIPYKTYNKLLLNEQQAEIAAANLEGLEQCPYCDFKAICDPIEVDTVFSCQNPDCFKVTCRLCHETSHLPKTCEEVKKDRGLNARHKIEEARSAAMMRACPSCKTHLIKELGCNKMRCQCGAVMCYVCQADLSKLRDGYEHFDRNNTSGKKCALYDAAGVDRHVKEANDAEVEAIRAAKQADSTIEEQTLQIETGKAVPVITTTPDRNRHPGGRFPIAAQRARRRAQVLPAPRINRPPIPAIPVQPAHMPAWPNNIVPNAPVQHGDAGVDLWRNVIALNQFDPPMGPRDRPRAPRNPNREYDDLLNRHDVWRPDEIAPMDLNFNYDLQAQAQRDMNNVHNIAAAQRMNDFRNEVHRRRTHRQRRYSDRDVAPPQQQADQVQAQAQPPSNFDAQGQLHQRNDLLQGPLPPEVLEFHRNFERFEQAMNGPWREQYRPPTPIPERPNVRNNAAEILEYRGLPIRRGTVPQFGNAQAAVVNQGQGQVQHRPPNNDNYGYF